MAGADANQNQEYNAQTGQTTQLAPPPETPAGPVQAYPVRGVVLNSVTHRPVARALVNGQQDAVLTDSEGRFELQLPARTMVLQVTKPGYDTGRNSPPLIVEVGPDKPDITAYLRPDGLISGQINFSNSDTADGIMVRISRRTAMNGRNRWVTEQMVSTNTEGNFRAAGLRPGAYMISTELERDQDAPQSSGYGAPVTYFPGVPDPAAAAIINLTTGQHAQADFSLTRQKFFPVTAIVNGLLPGDGTYLQAHDITDRDAGGGVRPDPRTGVAQLWVPNGTYYLDAHRFDPSGTGRSNAYGRVNFRVAGAPVSGLNLTLLPMHGIPVNVQKQFNNQVPGTTPGASQVLNGISQGGGDAGQPSPSLSISLTPANDEFSQANDQGGGNLVRRRGSNGDAFELPAVEDGKYWITAFPYQGYVSSITSGGADLGRDPLVVGPGSTASPIEVTLRDDPGLIQGRIVHQGTSGVSTTGDPSTASAPTSDATGSGVAAPLGQVYIYAIPLFPSAGQLVESGASPTGEFGLSNLAPGNYRIVAFDNPQEIEFHTAEGLAKYSSVGQIVTVEAGATANIQVDSSAIVSGENQ